MTDRELFYVVLGAVVRHLRRRKGWSQTTLGEHVGLSQAAVSRIEDASTAILSGTVRLLAPALGRNLGALYTAVDNGVDATKKAAKAISRTALTKDGRLRDDLDPSGLVQFVVATML